MASLDRLPYLTATSVPAISLVQPEATAEEKIPDQQMMVSRVRLAARCIIVVAGVVEALFGRNDMNPDGVSYLDLGDAMMRGDWKAAVNAHWSPLYPFLQGLAVKVFRPKPYWQFSVAHLVNFLIFLFALASFEFFLRSVVALQKTTAASGRETRWFPEWAMLAVGYAIFLWSSLSMTLMWQISPDILVAGLLYLAAGILMRIWARPQSFAPFILLGGVLGIGYLAKAPFFPLAFVFLILAGVLAGEWRRTVPRVLAGFLVFSAIAVPWVSALSHAKGRFMFGDSARLNRVLWIDGASPSYYFLKLGTAGGHYTHPIRQILNSPPVYEFAGPIKGTLPVWFDPSYWSDGAIAQVSVKKQLAVFADSVGFYLHLLLTSQVAMFVGFSVLCFMSGRSVVLRQMRARWPVWLIGLAGLAMYGMVHIELRYIAAFAALFWVGLFSGLEMPTGRDGWRLTGLVTLAVVIAMAGPTAMTVMQHLRTTLAGQPNQPWQVANSLERLGVRPGDKVARVGGGFGAVYWARVAGVSVVAEVPDANSVSFWYARPEVQEQVIQSFEHLGVKAVVADMTGVPSTPGPQWHSLGNGFFALKIDGPAPSNADQKTAPNAL